MAEETAVIKYRFCAGLITCAFLLCEPIHVQISVYGNVFLQRVSVDMSTI